MKKKAFVSAILAAIAAIMVLYCYPSSNGDDNSMGIMTEEAIKVNAAVKRQNNKDERIIIEESGVLDNSVPYQIITDNESGVQYMVLGGFNKGARYSISSQVLYKAAPQLHE